MSGDSAESPDSCDASGRMVPWLFWAIIGEPVPWLFSVLGALVPWLFSVPVVDTSCSSTVCS
ncbi:hypothetical protein [Streptomyces qinglanensis]|uniref:Uncharacterized protein n=1 Tax=Streptomyces qinglanensis TaxID=943816 RepID=A0A1H9W0Y2_9ACTN|nr:hypothetical protein [Streptomyces qinglanensis]SES27488.1 hypothetical protein SAMN05421870_114129 [Streptomyces qinglanensis]